ncbi:MAG: hypothetical protein ACQESG_05580 [Nanobdellota archaeon]
MKTSLDTWIEKEHFIVANSNRYIVFPYEGKENFLYFYGRQFAIEDAGPVAEFDKESLLMNQDYVRRKLETITNEENKKVANIDLSDADMAEMFIRQVKPIFENKRRYEHCTREDFTIENLDVANHIVQGPMFAFNGFLLDLSPGAKENEYIHLAGTNYRIHGSNLSAESLKNRYRTEFSEQINKYFETERNRIKEHMNSKDDEVLQAARKGEYEADGYGFVKRGKDYFVFANTGTYCLYEPTTDEYFQFPNAQVAVRIQSGKAITWDDPIIMNSYTHPGLEYIGLQMQELCPGSDREKYTLYRQQARKNPELTPIKIAETLQNGYTQVLQGYVSKDIGSAWKKLTEPVFHDLKTDSPTNITNKR